MLAQDESIWQWIPSRLCSYEDTNKYVIEALKKREIELEMLFVIRLQSTQESDVFNEKSRRAIERIGAKPEGILRNHKICANGRIRDTIYYSLTFEEWPAAKARLQERLK